MADDLLLRLNLKRLLQVARQAKWPSTQHPVLTGSSCRQGATVAIALDEAFHCYFPDTLDALEMQGAQLCDFSPLRAESLPPHTDLVLLGCGHPERYAARLAANVCLKQALLSHVRSGRRVYAEGGGLAYICEVIRVGSDVYPMAGLLPAIARYRPTNPQPTEFRLAHPSWLGPPQALIRGYLNGSWQLETVGPLINFVDDPEHRLDLVGFRQVIGSRVHLHFSAQPSMLHTLLHPLPSRTC
jgi:cobyrinic acid a,c-diamide synthase